MLVNLSGLFPVEGESKTYAPGLEMTQSRVADTVYDIVEKGPLPFMVTSRGDRKLTLVETADLVPIMPCARCLGPMRVLLHLEIGQELNMNQGDEERVEGLGERPYTDGYKLNIDQLVDNELTLGLPMVVLCNDDCKGICDRCDTNFDCKTCDCDNRPPDLKTSAIQDIFKQSREV